MSRQWLILGIFAGCALGGCGTRSEPGAPVSGVVRYRSYALHTGSVVFVPMEERGASGPLAIAEIGRDGSYLLKTAQNEGARPGWYRITVAAVDMPPSPAGGYPLPRLLVPMRYADPTASGLSCEVHAGKDNRIDLNLD